MKAAVLHGPGTRFRIEDVQLDPPRDSEALVRIAATGVCRSDHHLLSGTTPHPMPVVCGHEGAGVVEEVGGGVTRVRPGDHVVLSWAPTCGSCFFCTHGLPAQCEAFLAPLWAGTMMDGTTRLSLPGRGGARLHHYCALATFAEKAVVPASCCVPIRRDVPLASAALVGCAVATGVGAALFRARVQAGSSVVVYGCGGVGMNVVQGAAIARAATIVAVDPGASKREQALRLGATHAIDPAADDPVASVRTLTGGRGADYAFEAVGRPTIMGQAIASARRGGTIVLVGLGGRDEPLAVSSGDFTRSDKVLTSAYYGGCDPARDMPRLIDWYAEGRLKLDELIGRRRPLEQINEAFDDMMAGDVIRTIIAFDGEAGLC